MLSELLLACCKVCLSLLTRRRRLELNFDLSISSQSCSSTFSSSSDSSSSSSFSSSLAFVVFAVVVVVVVIAVEVVALVARGRRQRQAPRRRHRTVVCCCSVCSVCCDDGSSSSGGGGRVDDGGGCVRFGIAHCACGSHCNSRTIDGSLFAPSMNSSRLSLPSLLRSIWRKILSVRFSGVLSSSGIFITEPTIL